MSVVRPKAGSPTVVVRGCGDNAGKFGASTDPTGFSGNIRTEEPVPYNKIAETSRNSSPRSMLAAADKQWLRLRPGENPIALAQCAQQRCRRPLACLSLTWQGHLLSAIPSGGPGLNSEGRWSRLGPPAPKANSSAGCNAALQRVPLAGVGPRTF